MRLSHFIFLLSLASVAGAGYLLWFGNDFLQSEFPDVGALARSYPVVTYASKGKPPRVSLSRIRPGNWVGLDEISKAAKGAIVVSEDWAFYQHGGYDPNQIKEAIKEDFEEHGFARGASTITQQVVRNVFLEKDKNLWRKLKELFLAVKLEHSVHKNRILEVYLNIAEWGEGVYGINQASHLYFHKEPGELGAKEGAFLAMLLPSPKRYSQSFRSRQLTDYARSTIDSILGKMVQAKYITEEERVLERLSPLSFEANAGSAL
jgi:monofunctional biosynthetic peptidoglycan transglycosylase